MSPVREMNSSDLVSKAWNYRIIIPKREIILGGEKNGLSLVPKALYSFNRIVEGKSSLSSDNLDEWAQEFARNWREYGVGKLDQPLSDAGYEVVVVPSRKVIAYKPFPMNLPDSIWNTAQSSLEKKGYHFKELGQVQERLLAPWRVRLMDRLEGIVGFRNA